MSKFEELADLLMGEQQGTDEEFADKLHDVFKSYSKARVALQMKDYASKVAHYKEVALALEGMANG